MKIFKLNPKTLLNSKKSRVFFILIGIIIVGSAIAILLLKNTKINNQNNIDTILSGELIVTNEVEVEVPKNKEIVKTEVGYIKNRTNIKVTKENKEEIEKYIKEIGAKVVNEIPELGYITVLTLPDIEIDQEKVKQFEAEIDVSLFEYNDPEMEKQWGLEYTNSIEANKNLGKRSKNKVTIAIVDSGSCENHPDMIGKFLKGYNAIDGSNDTTDEVNHGCGISSIIAATTNNGVGLVGVNEKAQILPIKVFGKEQKAQGGIVAKGILKAVEMGAKYIILSLGYYQESTLIKESIEYAIGKGVTIISAAGNDGLNKTAYPAAYKGVISVGALNNKGEKAYFSNMANFYGPGQGIIVASTNGGYRMANGTSYAAGYIAGVITLEQYLCQTTFGNAKGGIVRIDKQNDKWDNCKNTAPKIVSEIQDGLQLYTGADYIYTVSAEDLDKDDLKYTATGSTGLIFENNTVIFRNVQPGNYEYTVNVSDGESNVTQTKTFTVINKPVVSKPTQCYGGGVEPLYGSELLRNAKCEFETAMKAEPMNCAVSVVSVINNNGTRWTLVVCKTYILQLNNTGCVNSTVETSNCIPVLFKQPIAYDPMNPVHLESKDVTTPNGRILGRRYFVELFLAQGYPKY